MQLKEDSASESVPMAMEGGGTTMATEDMEDEDALLYGDAAPSSATPSLQGAHKQKLNVRWHFTMLLFILRSLLIPVRKAQGAGLANLRTKGRSHFLGCVTLGRWLTGDPLFARLHSQIRHQRFFHG